MVVLNISFVNFGDRYNGMTVAIPQMVGNLKRFNEHTGLINLGKGVLNENYFINSKYEKLEKLVFPFNKPDIVVFHGIWIKEYLSISKELDNKSIPYIIVPHGQLTKTALQIKRIKKIFARIIFFNTFINNAKSIHFLSEAEKNESKCLKDSFVCGLGVTMPTVVKEYNTNDVKQIVFIGRIDPYIKGLDLLLNAVGKLKNNFIENKCKLVLCGPYRGLGKEEIDKLITSNGLEDILEIRDPVLGEEKYQMLLESDVFIQTSRSEGLPQGLLEALSVGLPCAITEGTRLGNQVKKYKCGLVCETNEEAISEMLIQLFNKKIDLKKASENAIKMISENYTWDIVSLKLKEKLNELSKQ